MDDSRHVKIATHSFVYNYGERDIKLTYKPYSGTPREKIIHPGDSFYARPSVEHGYSLLPPKDDADDMAQGRVYIVRIPGNLTREVMLEVSLCDPRGKKRIGHETKRWYN